jgi:helicase
MVEFPTYVPVATYDDQHSLDRLVRPYLDRLARAVMVSYHYARNRNLQSSVPVLLDSGGFVSLRKIATVREERQLGVIYLQQQDGVERIHPTDILDVQEMQADVAFTLDLPVPAASTRREANRRLKLSMANAAWALENRRRRDLPLFVCIPVTDLRTLRSCVADVARAGFDGVALGGLVPRASDQDYVLAAVETTRVAAPELPVHVFGLGKPQLVRKLFDMGADSVDSSSYVRAAADGKLWQGQHEIQIVDPSPLERMHIALCNLAMATGVAMPLSMSSIAFTTHSLAFAGRTS